MIEAPEADVAGKKVVEKKVTGSPGGPIFVAKRIFVESSRSWRSSGEGPL